MPEPTPDAGGAFTPNPAPAVTIGAGPCTSKSLRQRVGSCEHSACLYRKGSPAVGFATWPHCAWPLVLHSPDDHPELVGGADPKAPCAPSGILGPNLPHAPVSDAYLVDVLATQFNSRVVGAGPGVARISRWLPAVGGRRPVVVMLPRHTVEGQ
jgi:hypothetical protein